MTSKWQIFMVLDPLHFLGKLFLGGSGWILTSNTYIHYGPWLLCLDEPLKHLFMASGSLKKAQNRPQNGKFSWFWTPYIFWEAFFGWPWWLLACKSYIHYGPWLLCPDEPLKCLFMASASLKKAQNRPQNGKFSWFWTLHTFWESFFGLTMEDPCL